RGSRPWLIIRSDVYNARGRASRGPRGGSRDLCPLGHVFRRASERRSGRGPEAGVVVAGHAVGAGGAVRAVEDAGVVALVGGHLLAHALGGAGRGGVKAVAVLLAVDERAGRGALEAGGVEAGDEAV